MRIAVIPARGGSKRIPRKNIKLFCGKPMIAWSIEAALKSELFHEVVVSTDDPEIASVALKYGASVPFYRPTELSDDHTATVPVIKHAISWLMENRSYKISEVCCIYATAPFLSYNDLTRGLGSLEKEACSYAFSVTSYAFPIQRAVRITSSGRTEMISPELFPVRSQDLDEAYHDAGQFYWGTPEAWLTKDSIFSEWSVPVVIPRYRVQDIDTLEDWVRAEFMFKALRASKYA